MIPDTLPIDNNNNSALHLQFVFASCVACLKLLKADTENESHILYARLFFGFFHAFFLVMFLKTKNTIASMMETQNVKMEAGDQLKAVAKGVLLKAAAIGAVHYKSHLIQPLVISSIMGIISLLENHYTYNSVAGTLPFLLAVRNYDAAKKHN